MPFNRRKFDTNIKSLIHFDYPYFAEPFDGCRDEINGNIFARYGGVKFVGTQIPCDKIIAGTPKFGYRCLCSASNIDYIAAKNRADIFSLKANCDYEFECFIMAMSQSTQGNIISLVKDNESVFTIALTTGMRITVQCPEMNLNVLSSETLESSVWYFVRVCLHSGSLKIYVSAGKSNSDSEPDSDGWTSETAIPPAMGASGSGEYEAVSLAADELRIGGLNGFIDEFLMRDSKSTSGIPSEPHQGFLDINLAGGYGNGSSDIVMGNDAVINSHAKITLVSGTLVKLSKIAKGQLSDFSAGSEIMFHVIQPRGTEDSETGKFAFRRILSTRTKSSILYATIDEPVTEEFDLASCIASYYVQAVSVPNLNTFTLPAERTLSPLLCAAVRDYAGGVIVLKTKSDMTIDGKIITALQDKLKHFGPRRTDKQQGTHADLINRFIINYGGGIMLFCGGTLRISSAARIGALESALPGFGGNSAFCTTRSGQGGVGGGGGGCQAYKDGRFGYYGFYNAGYLGLATGAEMWFRNRREEASTGGTQGITSGANGSLGGSGGACGNACTTSMASTSKRYIGSGASVIIAANKLSLDENALKTGGLEGLTHSADTLPAGSVVYEPGSGTGFCYIAAKELI